MGLSKYNLPVGIRMGQMGSSGGQIKSNGVKTYHLGLRWVNWDPVTSTWFKFGQVGLNQVD